ncbi:MAG: agmatine deiminase family protein [Planctomycetota bacterium]|jgi:agmatine/peptidylarginine deiminase
MCPSKRFLHSLFTISLVLLMAGTALAQWDAIQAKQKLGKPIPLVVERDLKPLPDPARATPPGPVHTIAEWEESEGVMILWSNFDLINRLQEVNMVYIPVDNQAEKDSWINQLTNHGIPLTNIEFLFIRTNSIYTRDYGPFFIWDANGDMGICNYTCHYGYYDDLFPYEFSQLYGINFYESGLDHVGGNWYPNAFGTAFSTTLVYTENYPYPKSQTDHLIYDYFGVSLYNTCVVAPTTIEHHDCWGKPSNPETMLVVQFPEDSYYHPYGEYVNDHYATLESPWGRPYKIIRLPMFKMGSGWFEFKPYCNSLVSNKRVYVGICNHPDDQIALDIFQEAFPGYEIVGVDHQGTGFNDAVHCRTRNFRKRELVRIYAYPPGDTEDPLYGYVVRAEVIPPKGTSLTGGYPMLHWTSTGGSPFHDVVMTATGNPNEYEASIPGQAMGTTVSFYIDAENDTGVHAIYPLVAPDGLMEFMVREDSEAPELSRFVPTRSAAAGQWPPVIRTLCKDDMYTPEVKVEYSINGVPQADATLTREYRCYWYSGVLGGTVSAGDVVKYKVVASDDAVFGPNTSSLPLLAEIYCPVAGPGSVAVVDMSQRPFTGPFLEESLGKLGIPYMRYTTWPTDWNEHDVWFILLGVFADNYQLSEDQANDIIAALQAGNNIYMEGGEAWCFDPQKDLLNPWFSVEEVKNGGDMHSVYGVSGSIMDGLDLAYRGTCASIDEIAAVRPNGLALFRSSGGKDRMVLNEAGTYKTIASTFALGGLRDGQYPSTKIEVLVRILHALAVDIDLYAGAEAKMGYNVPLHIKGTAGDVYLLLGSLADNYVNTGYGAFRLDQAYLFYIWQGVIPSSGMEELVLPVPRLPEYAGYEVHLQAVVGEELKVGKAELTNREILTLIE